jgi:hypothetical protein
VDPLIAKGAADAKGVVLAGLKNLRRELARRRGSEAPLTSLSEIDDALDEAMGVLANTSENLRDLIVNGVKVALARPAMFRSGAPERWIVTEIAQHSIKAAAAAAVRGGEDLGAAATAIRHYDAIVDEDDPAGSPTGDEVFIEALDFILRSLRRDLSVRDRLILGGIEAIAEKIDERLPLAPGEIVDEHVIDRLDKIRKRRFFTSSATRDNVASFATQLIRGNLKSASAAVRVLALSWCARIMAFDEELNPADYLGHAQILASGDTEELRVARAFLAARQEWEDGLKLLNVDASGLQATAAFQIIRHGGGAERALDFVERGAIEPSAFDSDGRLALISTLVARGRIDDAVSVARTLSDADFEATPALLWIAGAAIVASRLPDDLRPLVLQNVPANPAWFPLGDDSDSVETRRIARALLKRAAQRCADLKLPKEAAATQRYALWLGLRDPDDRDAALEELKKRLAEPGGDIAYLPFALGFGLEVNREQAARLLDARLVREPTPSDETVGALVALVLDEAVAAPERGHELLLRHRKILETYLEPNSLLTLELRMLIESGRLEDAKSLLASERAQHLPEHLRHVFASALDSGNNEPSIEALEAAYAADPQLGALWTLLQAYAAAGAPTRYVELARKFLADVPDIERASDIINILSRHGYEEEAVDVVEKLGDAVHRSPALLGQIAWLYYRQGQFARAGEVLAVLEAQRDDNNDWQLRYQLLIATGEWEALDGFFEDQWQDRDKRSALELAQLGNSAAQAGSKRARDFALEAARKDGKSAHVLAGAYSAITAAGLEENVEGAQTWILQAAELSGDDGPIKRMSLEELLGGQGEWEARVTEAMNAQAAAAAPISSIASALRRTWLELQLVPLIANPTCPDVRTHAIVGLFSGRAVSETASVLDKGPIALDVTALVTLAHLNLLEDVFEAFDQVIVRHDVLTELFEQRNRLIFHQPSRIAFSHRLLGLVDRGKLSPFNVTTTPDLGLLADLGEERAEMLADAAGRQDGQFLLIHPFPITKVGSLLSEAVPLERYQKNLASCGAVVDAVLNAGQLTKKDTQSAYAYLRSQEQRWPNEPAIEAGATLYLSEVAVAYFHHLGLLDRIADAGLTAVVSKSSIAEARALIDHESRSAAVDAVLKRARDQISRAFSEGHLRFNPVPPKAAEMDAGGDGDSASTAGLASAGGLFVTDDRFMNRFSHFDHEGSRIPILSSIELLTELAEKGALEPESLADVKTRLRREGAIYISVTAAELTGMIAETALRVRSGSGERSIAESAELKGLRENVRLAQARGWFNPAVDARWLTNLQLAVSAAIVAQWDGTIPDELALARSDWLLGLLGLTDWAESLVQHDMQGIAETGAILDAVKLAISSGSVPKERRDAFEDWLEARVLTPLLETSTRTREALLGHVKTLLTGSAEDLASDSDGISLRIAIRAGFDPLPKALRLALLDDEVFRLLVGYSLEVSMQVGEVAFLRERVFDVVAKIYAKPADPMTITDNDGGIWEASTDVGDNWAIVLRKGDASYRLRGLPGLHPSAKTRIAILDKILSSAGIAREAMDQWRTRLAKGPLQTSEVGQLETAISPFPPFSAIAIAESLNSGGVETSTLVPRDVQYFERLVGSSAAKTLPEFLDDPARNEMEWAVGRDGNRAALLLLRAAHPSILDPKHFAALSVGEWKRLARFIAVRGDLFSKLAFVELALPLAADRPELEQPLLNIAKQFRSLGGADPAGPLQLLSSLVIFIEGELGARGTLAGWPPFRRRQAAFAQAALIARTVQGQIDTGRFAEFCTEQRGFRFLVQSLMDLRIEPRWRPEFISAEQLRNEIIGRASNAAAAAPEDRLSEKLKVAFRSNEGLQGQVAVPQSFWPGPLEGSRETMVPPLPDHLLEALETRLTARPLDIEAVNLLENLELVFELPDDLVERATTALKTESTQLFAPLEPAAVHAHLLGLAYVAATRRSTDLADTVRQLARQQRPRCSISIGEEAQLALVASAAAESEAEWRDRIGSWMLELAAGISESEAATLLLGWLNIMGEIDPALRARLGRARANLRLLLQL